ncbi:unnamed protein product [Blumeria hordei]|uniref:Uncharacterized protein n=1 Tax=Blumeria hordei TaxID=2867405 RepID=A0A383UMW3_BLUHO|nr:unnamed protein product [Blumeria hordei]
MGPVSPSHASPRLISETGGMHMTDYCLRNLCSHFGAGSSVNLFLRAEKHRFRIFQHHELNRTFFRFMVEDYLERNFPSSFCFDQKSTWMRQ